MAIQPCVNSYTFLFLLITISIDTEAGILTVHLPEYFKDPITLGLQQPKPVNTQEVNHNNDNSQTSNQFANPSLSKNLEFYSKKLPQPNVVIFMGERDYSEMLRDDTSASTPFESSTNLHKNAVGAEHIEGHGGELTSIQVTEIAQGEQLKGANGGSGYNLSENTMVGESTSVIKTTVAGLAAGLGLVVSGGGTAVGGIVAAAGSSVGVATVVLGPVVLAGAASVGTAAGGGVAVTGSKVGVATTLIGSSVGSATSIEKLLHKGAENIENLPNPESFKMKMFGDKFGTGSKNINNIPPSPNHHGSASKMPNAGKNSKENPGNSISKPDKDGQNNKNTKPGDREMNDLPDVELAEAPKPKQKNITASSVNSRSSNSSFLSETVQDEVKGTIAESGHPKGNQETAKPSKPIFGGMPGKGIWDQVQAFCAIIWKKLLDLGWWVCGLIASVLTGMLSLCCKCWQTRKRKRSFGEEISRRQCFGSQVVFNCHTVTLVSPLQCPNVTDGLVNYSNAEG